MGLGRGVGDIVKFKPNFPNFPGYTPWPNQSNFEKTGEVVKTAVNDVQLKYTITPEGKNYEPVEVTRWVPWNDSSKIRKVERFNPGDKVVVTGLFRCPHGLKPVWAIVDRHNDPFDYIHLRYIRRSGKTDWDHTGKILVYAAPEQSKITIVDRKYVSRPNQNTKALAFEVDPAIWPAFLRPIFERELHDDWFNFLKGYR